MRTSRHVVIGVLSVVLLLGAGCGDDGDATTPTSTTTVTTSAPPTSTTPTSTVSPTVTPTSSTPNSTTTTTAPGARPADAPTPTVRAGGGSGEIVLRWRTVAGATGYRVQRASSPRGPFTVSADVDVVSGHTTRGDGVTNVWSPAADEFEYVEVVGSGSVRYLRVVAYNDAGEGPVSAAVCGAPPGGTGCESPA
jgi:hypothetical protein